MMNNSISFLRGAGVAIAGAAALVSLSSCGDDEKTTEAQTPAAKPAAPAASSSTRDALFEDMLYGVGKSLTTGITDRTFTRGIPSPECWDKMCNYLEKLEAYYTELSAQAPGTMAVARLATRLAQVRAGLASPKAQDDYENALKAFNAMKNADKSSVEGKKVLCDIEEGLGTILMGQKKPEQALAHLDKVQQLTGEILFALVPKAEISTLSGMPSTEISEATVAHILACTNLAICKHAAEKVDEAKACIAECEELIKAFPSLTPRMGLQFARLVSVLGDIERVEGNRDAALSAWRRADGVYEAIGRQFAQAAQGNVIAAGYVLEAQTRINALAKAIKVASDEVTDEENEKAESEEPAAEPAAEETAEEPVEEAVPMVTSEAAAPATPAPAPAVAAPAPAQPAKPAANRPRPARHR